MSAETDELFWELAEREWAVEDYEREQADRRKEYESLDPVVEIESREFTSTHDQKAVA